MKTENRKLKQFPSRISQVLELAAQIAEEQSLSIFVVGGFVRDFFLKVKNWDIDLAVESGDFEKGFKFARNLAKRLKGKITIHRGFGTTVIFCDFKGKKMRIDVANARKERYKKPGVLPDVCSAGIKEDLARRDFSINAMAVCLNKRKEGELVDPFGGRQDLERKKIRILHNLSFIDDPTRILRAVRFSHRYNFNIEEKTEKLIKQAIKKGMLKKLNEKRIKKEIELILQEKKPMSVFSQLISTGGFND